MPARINYDGAFRELLDALPDGQRLAFHDLTASLPFKSVGADTVKKHFKTFIDENAAYLSRITGSYPKAETIIALVEQWIGPITETNLDLANVCSRAFAAMWHVWWIVQSFNPSPRIATCSA